RSVPAPRARARAGARDRQRRDSAPLSAESVRGTHLRQQHQRLWRKWEGNHENRALLSPIASEDCHGLSRTRTVRVSQRWRLSEAASASLVDWSSMRSDGEKRLPLGLQLSLRDEKGNATDHRRRGSPQTCVTDSCASTSYAPSSTRDIMRFACTGPTLATVPCSPNVQSPSSGTPGKLLSQAWRSPASSSVPAAPAQPAQ